MVIKSMLYVQLALAVLVCGSVTTIFAQDGATCPLGFFGPGCAICDTDEACASFNDNDSSYCDKSFAYSNATVVKSLLCDPATPEIVTGLIQPNSFLIRCFTGLQNSKNQSLVFASPADRELANGGKKLLQQTKDVADGTSTVDSINSTFFGDGEPYCDIKFRVVDPSVGVSCMANQCDMQPGSPNVRCAEISCECDDGGECGGGPLTTSLVSTVNGKAEIICDETAKNCDIKLGGLPISTIGANCRAGDCVLPLNATKETFNGNDGKYFAVLQTF